MQPQAIDTIQSTLGIQLPESYTSVVLSYPHPDDEDMRRHGLIDDPQRIVGVNLEHRRDGWFGVDWPETYFILGDDGCGDLYFLVVGDGDAVYFADHEGGSHPVDGLPDCWSAADVRGHVDGLLEIRRELEEHERRIEARARPWWQVWR